MNHPMISGIGMTSQRTRERLVKRLQQEGIKQSRILDVVRSTPRHLFVDEALAHRAYEDTALPIGLGQTISQPYIVAKMTEAVLGARMDKVLEIGTGCGYQTAILAQLFQKVYTIERIKTLQQQAMQRLKTLQLHNVEYRHADGQLGWLEKAPFNAIVITAAMSAIPESLCEQLASGGKMVLPVGSDGKLQELTLITAEEGEYKVSILEKVRFVPLVGGALA